MAARTQSTVCDPLAVRGLERLRFGQSERPAERLLQELAAHAAGQPLDHAFALAVSDWKRAGISPGASDVVLLAARRMD